LISLECARLGANVVCSDINPYAINLIKENYYYNKVNLKGTIDVRFGSLFSVIKNNEKFDLIIFNPPYLPSDQGNILDKNDWINIATDGGCDGLDLINKFIENVKFFLKIKGRAYFVFSSLSDRNKLNNLLINYGLKSSIISSRRYNDEIIDVYVVSD